MKTHIGVTHDGRELKRLLLLFDRVAFTGLRTLLEIAHTGLSLPEEGLEIPPLEEFYTELNELKENGIIFEPFSVDLENSMLSSEAQSDHEIRLIKLLEENDKIWTPLVFKSMALAAQKKGYWQSFTISEDPSEIERQSNLVYKLRQDLEVRLIAARMRRLGEEAYPIAEFSPDLKLATPKSKVIEVVLSGIPMPDDDISFRSLLEFRSDPNSKRLVLALRRWIRKISSEQLSPAELGDEIEWLISENREHMRLHKLRANNTRWKILLKTPIDLLQNLVKINLTKSIDAMFDAREVQLSLLAEELKAPGYEVSYIAKIRDSFENT